MHPSSCLCSNNLEGGLRRSDLFFYRFSWRQEPGRTADKEANVAHSRLVFLSQNAMYSCLQWEICPYMHHKVPRSQISPALSSRGGLVAAARSRANHWRVMGLDMLLTNTTHIDSVYTPKEKNFLFYHRIWCMLCFREKFVPASLCK